MKGKYFAIFYNHYWGCSFKEHLVYIRNRVKKSEVMIELKNYFLFVPNKTYDVWKVWNLSIVFQPF